MFELLTVEQLTVAELGQLGVHECSEARAILIPTSPSYSAKAICLNTFNLLNSFRAPILPPTSFRDADGSNLVLLARLVLDSVLEVEHEGSFFSGARAAEVLQLVPAVQSKDTSAPARLSREALQYAEALGTSYPPALSSRLYSYNRLPFSPRWTERTGALEALASWLASDKMGLRAQVAEGWTEVPPPPDNLRWRYFCRDGDARGGPFKLYLNPRIDFLRESIETILPILSENSFRSFKLALDKNGLLRPDKFVAYAASRVQVESASHSILAKLQGMPAHAVPFTAVIDYDGLLSWGIDPPRSERLSNWQGKSWRRWITDILAVALIAARTQGASDACEFALQRVTLEGIDVNSWMPSHIPWAQTVAP